MKTIDSGAPHNPAVAFEDTAAYKNEICTTSAVYVRPVKTPFTGTVADTLITLPHRPGLVFTFSCGAACNAIYLGALNSYNLF